MSIPRVCPTGCQHRALFAIPAPPNQRLRFFSLAGQRVLSTSSVSRAPSVIQRIRDRVTGRAYQRGEETGSHAEALDAIKQQRAALAGDYKPAKTWDGLTFEGVTQQRKEGSQFNALFSRGHVVASQANLEAELYRVVIDVARNQAWIRFRKNQQDAMKRRRAGSSVQDELVLEGLGHIYSQSSHIKRPSASAGQVCSASSRSTDAVGQEVFALSVSSSTKLDQSIDTAVGDAVNQIMLHGSRKQAVTPHKIRSIRQLSQFHVRDGVPSAELVRVAKQVDIRSAERFEVSFLRWVLSDVGDLPDC